MHAYDTLWSFDPCSMYIEFIFDSKVASETKWKRKKSAYWFSSRHRHTLITMFNMVFMNQWTNKHVCHGHDWLLTHKYSKRINHKKWAFFPFDVFSYFDLTYVHQLISCICVLLQITHKYMNFEMLFHWSCVSHH